MSSPNKRRPTISAVLESGEVVESIRPREKETAFAVFDDKGVREEREITLPEGEILVPYSADNSLLSHKVVLLPAGVSEFESGRALRSRVQAFIHRYVDLSPLFEEVSSVYVLFSWLYDDFDALPYLRVRGDYGSGKSRFLLSVGSLCYVPIFASGASTVSPLFRIMDVFRGTLILDEADFRLSDERADVVKILNNGNAKGFPVLRSEISASKEINPTAFNVFGPKLIATRRSFEDRALESRSITEDLGLRPLRSDIPLNLPKAFFDEAEELRRALLLFRFKNRGKERDLSLFTSRFLSPRVSQLFAPLMAVVEEDEVRKRLGEAAKGFDRALHGDRSEDPAALLLSTLVELARGRETAIPIQELAEAFTARGVLDRPVTARYVGFLVRERLFLKPERRRGVFVLPVGEFAKLSALASRFGLVEDVGDIEDVGERMGEGEGEERDGVAASQLSLLKGVKSRPQRPRGF